MDHVLKPMRRHRLLVAMVVASLVGFAFDRAIAAVDPLEVAPSSTTIYGICNHGASFTCHNGSCNAASYVIPARDPSNNNTFTAGSRKFTSDAEPAYKCGAIQVDDPPAPGTPVCTSSARTCGQFQYYVDTTCQTAVPSWAQGNKPGYLKGCIN